MKDGEGTTLIEDKKITERWKEYFQELMNMENEREERHVPAMEEGTVAKVTADEVRNALTKMKNGKPWDLTTYQQMHGNA